MTPQDTLIGYVVIGGSPMRFPTRMVKDLTSANRLMRGWDRQVHRYYGGGFDTYCAALRRRADGKVYVTAGGVRREEPGTGYAGMGVGGSIAVDYAVEWLRARPARWRRKYGIEI